MPTYNVTSANRSGVRAQLIATRDAATRRMQNQRVFADRAIAWGNAVRTAGGDLAPWKQAYDLFKREEKQAGAVRLQAMRALEAIETMTGPVTVSVGAVDVGVAPDIKALQIPGYGSAEKITANTAPKVEYASPLVTGSTPGGATATTAKPLVIPATTTGTELTAAVNNLGLSFLQNEAFKVGAYPVKVWQVGAAGAAVLAFFLARR